MPRPTRDDAKHARQKTTSVKNVAQGQGRQRAAVTGALKGGAVGSGPGVAGILRGKAKKRRSVYAAAGQAGSEVARGKRDVHRGEAIRAEVGRGRAVLNGLTTLTAPFTAIHELSAIERSEIVEAGVPARLLVRLADALAMSKERLYQTIGVSRATVDRKLKTDTTLSTADSEHAMGLARLVGQVEQLVQESGDSAGFDGGHWVAEFLNAPSPALGGRRPAELMRTSDGRAVVATLVSQMQTGAYA